MLWPDLQLLARFKADCCLSAISARKKLPPVLCRYPVSACKHSMYSYSYTRDVDCLSAVSARKYCTPFAAPVLCRCLVSACEHGNHWLFGLAAVLYRRIRLRAASGQLAIKRAELRVRGCESGRPASKRVHPF